MCNTRSNVYLQSMKIYTLSVNTLTWNLTSERHDNCASCLGLILPIRWVTPPPNVLFKVFHSWRYICYVFTFGLASISTCLHDYLCYDDYICILVFCPLQHSLIAMSSCWIFELSECDRTLTSLCFLSQTLSLQIICILLKLSNVFSASLSAEDTETTIKSVFNAHSSTWNPEK